MMMLYKSLWYEHGKVSYIVSAATSLENTLLEVITLSIELRHSLRTVFAVKFS
jgi:hypothetical protein